MRLRVTVRWAMGPPPAKTMSNHLLPILLAFAATPIHALTIDRMVTAPFVYAAGHPRAGHGRLAGDQPGPGRDADAEGRCGRVAGAAILKPRWPTASCLRDAIGTPRLDGGGGVEPSTRPVRMA